MLDGGACTQLSLAVLACQAEVNSHSAELLGLAAGGLAYLPAPGGL